MRRPPTPDLSLLGLVAWVKVGCYGRHAHVETLTRILEQANPPKRHRAPHARLCRLPWERRAGAVRACLDFIRYERLSAIRYGKQGKTRLDPAPAVRQLDRNAPGGAKRKARSNGCNQDRA